MQKLKFIFPMMGVVILGLWFFKAITEVEPGSVQSISDIASKYQILALLGFACFWIYPAINWFQSGTKSNASEVVKALKDDAYPTHSRKLPIWAHALRLSGLMAFICFMLGAVRTVNDEIIFNWNYFFPAAISAALFFLLPFAFQRKIQ